MDLHSALFNWLQIKIVAEARPDDSAARETLDFFEQILREDHRLSSFQVMQADDRMYYVHYETEGKANKQDFDKETADQLLNDIISNPKYNE